MVFTKALKILSVLVVIISVLVILVEKYLPEQEELRRVEDLPEELRDWYQRGKYYNVFGHRVFAIWNGDSKGSGEEEAIILIHGFPASSFDYHRAVQTLEAGGHPVLMFDHLGFGFSDRPKENFVYSLHDHAEVALELWRQIGIRRAHLVAHDMGDSILTEILTRRQKNMLPDYFNDFFQSITFSNGGMRYDLINFRLSQILLRVPFLGPFLSAFSSKLPTSVTNRLSRQQLLSIWGPLEDPATQEKDRDSDIENLILLARFNGGNKIAHKTITYLNDRARFEPRWYSSLSKLDLPCLLLWGDSDSVSPMEIPKYLAQNVIPPKLVKGVTLRNTGHFLMLERPVDWARLVLEFISKSKDPYVEKKI